MRPALVIIIVTSFLHYVTAAGPVDTHVTQQTRNLYNVMRTIARDSSKVMVGKHQPTMFGVHGGHNPYWTYPHEGRQEAWLYNPDMVHRDYGDELCDPCMLTHDFPAVVGFDYSIGADMAEVPPYLIHKAHERGAIITISWHADNFITGHEVHIQGDNGDVLHTLQKLLPGGDHHHQYLAALDGLADWAKARVDSKGHLIPIIFRPFHEADGGWFWWGLGNEAHNSNDDIKNIYRETVKYLRDSKGVHNFLYAFSPDCGGPSGTDDDIYPGDEYVDIIGTDCYMTSDRNDQYFANAVEKVVQFAEAHDKIAAISEFGAMPATLDNHPNFFTQHILRSLISSPSAMRVAYMLTWTNQCFGNSGNCAIYDPYPGHDQAGDYMNFYHDSHTMFLSDLKTHYQQLYN